MILRKKIGLTIAITPVIILSVGLLYFATLDVLECGRWYLLITLGIILFILACAFGGVEIMYWGEEE